MHISIGAFEINTAASALALLFGGIWLMGWSRTRIGYMLPLALGWWGLCIYWGLLAVSAGPAPVVDRSDIAPMVRGVLLVSVTLLAWGKVAMLLMAWRFSQARGADST